MSENDIFETEAYKKSAEKFRKYGPLAMTLKDKQNLHTTADERLKANPGKELHELMSESEILDFLLAQEEVISHVNTSQISRDTIAKENEATIGYLKVLNKLPDIWEDDG